MAKAVSKFNLFTEGGNDIEDKADKLFSAMWMITLGLVFLLNTTGVLSWSVWVYVFVILAKWWPIFLISGGISIILDGYKWSKWIIGLLWYVTLLMMLFLGFRLGPELDTEINTDNFPDFIIETVIEEADK